MLTKLKKGYIGSKENATEPRMHINTENPNSGKTKWETLIQKNPNSEKNPIQQTPKSPE